ncbi:MAG: PilZ domain-containing protein [Phycisphaerales bacterium]
MGDQAHDETDEHGANQRRHERNAFHDPVRARIRCAGSSLWFHAEVLEWSLSGIGAVCDRDLTPGTPVEIEIDGETRRMTGQVMHCQEAAPGCRILGIRLDASFGARLAG